MEVNFLFDYLSPYAYLAWEKLPLIKKELPDVKINFIPVLFAGLLNHWEQKGPAEIPPKRDFVFTQCLRMATRDNILFTLPKTHPFNPILSLRISLKEIAAEYQEKIISALWQAGWQQGKELSDPLVVSEILNENNIPREIIEKASSVEAKNKLRENTAAAIECGVFGVPTFLTGDNTLFWGLDSLPDLINYLKGNDNIDKQLLNEILNRKSSVERVKQP